MPFGLDQAPPPRVPPQEQFRQASALNSSRSLKNARAQPEPWLLAASLKLNHLSAQAIVAVYAQRMQIEESFRDLKSEQFGLGFSCNRSTQKNRLNVLLLVANLALFVLRLIGEVGTEKQMEFKFQSNTRRSRPVLSVFNLALQLVKHGMAAFPPRERMRYDHPALQLCGETSESGPIDLLLHSQCHVCNKP